MTDEAPALRWAGMSILAASFVALLQELAFIRWLPAQIRVLAYFPNLVLIGAFLGLGLGALRANGRSLLWLWYASLAAVAVWVLSLRHVVFTQSSESEHLWLLYFDLPRTAPVVHGVRVPIIGTFVLTALTFVPIGQFVGARLAIFRAASVPLRGYARDLLGSLIGVIGFAAMSFLQTKPPLWFALIFGAGVVL